ncbi:hypothetical protein SDC9_101219 [bioreactor metagenome]|uniref:Uncharacterized protein n=1 Tax=bioreactor metagenome TaxID=1076179 RepID=A0A645AQ37_9ZZZZ
MAVTLQGVEIVHLGHLIPDGDGQVRFALHQLLDDAVHDLGLGVIPVIENQLRGAGGIPQSEGDGYGDGRHEAGQNDAGPAADAVRLF